MKKKLLRALLAGALIFGLNFSQVDAADDRITSDDASDFVLIADAVPDVIQEIRYYSTYNFVGDRIDGYNKPVSMLTKEAAAALRQVSDYVMQYGYRLKIYDAYRPQKAVDHFVRWAEDIPDTRMKDYFYPLEDKSQLFSKGYIAFYSGHSRGSTVDLTLFDMRTGKEVDMGGTFDYFGLKSHPDYRGELTQQQIDNRMFLRDAMIKFGFKPLEEEWWHFTLKDEPYPDTYFTFSNDIFDNAVDREQLYQVALLQSLAMGYFDGSVSVGDFKTHGDIGIGTFDGLNGELIALDGVVYQALGNGKVVVADDSTGVPFGNITFFDEDFSVELKSVKSFDAMLKILNREVDKHGRNSFYAVKIDAHLNSILFRSELGQSKPYPTLVNALAKDQKEFTAENIDGTLVGLYCPDFAQSVNSVGWHFHFVSNDRKLGGHVMNVNIKNGVAAFDRTDAFNMALPGANNFDALDFNADLTSDIEKAEKGKYNKK